MILEIAVALGLGYYSILPPAEFREDNVNAVAFITSDEDRDALCTKFVQLPAPEGWAYVGCSNPANRLMIVPNPCNYPDETYARHMCHELGHVNGWPGNHPNGEEYKAPQTFPQTKSKE